MNCQSNKYVNLVTLIMVCVIFIQINVMIVMIFTLKNEQVKYAKEEEIIETNQLMTKAKEWRLKIPKIGVDADIKEGTDEQVINNAIGHFQETGYKEGNIGLVAGCNGYKENYFAKLEELQEGDVILYKYGDYEKQYKVVLNQVIDQKDWSYLSSTKENKLTLITGLPNEQEKRRCVQAVKI